METRQPSEGGDSDSDSAFHHSSEPGVQNSLTLYRQGVSHMESVLDGLVNWAMKNVCPCSAPLRPSALDVLHRPDEMRHHTEA
jgi:hypothetical protein